ncbi:glycosyltransferase [Mesorhizobium sp.]|uniref:glycosyltransferase n=1 Tax=Mesorhizobium sp. TaxID=1871066 RepID=UPI0011F78B66|nr:glycosyltransferase [Mesorhizobium sp.]TIO77091.1 MAG: glycosyltransferase [Mesorhizobium sp.]
MKQRTLNELFEAHRGKVSDKWEHCLNMYERLFQPLRRKPLHLLEIGVQNGGSLEVWAKYFEHARTITGVDIDRTAGQLTFDDARVKAIVADATDPAWCDTLAPPLDVVIDDGSHQSGDMIKSFLLLFPKLAPDGIYVVEDMQCSYYPEYQGGLFTPGSAMSFFKRLADVINHEHWDVNQNSRELVIPILARHDISPWDLDWLDTIDSIEFTNSCVVLRKRLPQEARLGRQRVRGEIESVVPGRLQYEGQMYERGRFTTLPPLTPRAVHPEDAIVNLETEVAHLDEQAREAREDAHAVGERLSSVEKELSSSLAARAELQQALTNAGKTIKAFEGELDARREEVATMEGELHSYRGEIASLRASTSWRVTRPLRAVRTITRKIGRPFTSIRRLALKQSRAMSLLLAPRETVRLAKTMRRRAGGLRPLLKVGWMVLRREGVAGLSSRLSRAALQLAGVNAFAGAEARLYFRRSLWRQMNGNASSFLGKHVSPDFRELSDLADGRHEPGELPFSILTPVFNTNDAALRAMLDSVASQSLGTWEQILVDDASTDPGVVRTLREYAASDSRFAVVECDRNRGISEATNEALRRARGRYVVLLDHDDTLHPDALLENARVISAYPEVDLIYSDEDKTNSGGEFYSPYFKPDWSPIHLLTRMFTGHLSVYRKTLVDEVGGFRPEFDGTQDYDLALRIAEKTDKVVHIPKVLYHWRVGAGSTAGDIDAKSGILEKQKKALEDCFRRRGIEGGVQPTDYPGNWRPVPDIPNPAPLVSIVIPTAGREGIIRGRNTDILQNCLRSVARSTYPNFEVVVSCNGPLSASAEEALRAFPRHTLVRYEDPVFNLADKINRAARAAQGEYLVLLNDDIEVKTPDWIENMIRICALDSVGCVGAKLLFENNTIQHAGVVLQDPGPSHVMIGRRADEPGPNMEAYLTREVIAVTGACMMVRSRLFWELDGFDEEFPLNYNDVDFCLRLRDLGHSVVQEPSAELYHFESLSKEGVFSTELDRLVARWGEIDDPYYNVNFDRSNPWFTPRPGWNWRDLRSEDYQAWLDRRVAARMPGTSSPDRPEGLTLSAVTSVYNTESRFLLELAQCINNQSHQRLEWILVDNGSTDPDTVATLREIAAMSNRATLVQVEKNKGILGGMRVGLENATGDYILPMDSDDLVTSDAAALISAFLIDHDLPELAYSDEDKCGVYSSRHSPFMKRDWDPVMFYGCCYVAHLCAIRRDTALKLNAYTDDKANGCHDWDTFLRFIRDGATPVHMNEVVYSWRTHPQSTASADPSVKPFTLVSQSHVLTQHLQLQQLADRIEIVENDLFGHAGMWRLRRKTGELPATFVVATQQSGADGNAERSVSSVSELMEIVRARSGEHEYIAIVDSALKIEDGDWISEAIGLCEVQDDIAFVGGTLHSDDATMLWTGGYRAYRNGETCPYHGRPSYHSGYHGEAFLQRSVDTFTPMFWLARAKRLENLCKELPDGLSFAELAGALAVEAAKKGYRTVVSPFMKATVRGSVREPPYRPVVQHPFPDGNAYYPLRMSSTAAWELGPAN